MFYKFVLAGALALGSSVVFGSTAFAQAVTAAPTSSVPSVAELSGPLNEQLMAQRNQRDPALRRDSLEDDDLEELNDGDLENLNAVGSTPVTFSVRLNTELFANSGDLVEFLVPVRYNPSDRLALEAVPVIKYFPESTSDEFNYGIKFAVEYRL